MGGERPPTNHHVIARVTIASLHRSTCSNYYQSTIFKMRIPIAAAFQQHQQQKKTIEK